MLALLTACDCRPPNTLCARRSPESGNACINPQMDRNNCGTCGNACPITHTCVMGRCECAHTTCGSSCVDTNSDPSNCGGCGRRCASNYTCSSGECISTTGRPGPPGPGPIVPSGTPCGRNLCRSDQVCLNCEQEPSCQPSGTTCCRPYSGAGGPEPVLCYPATQCVLCGLSASCHAAGAQCCVPQTAGQSALVCEAGQQCDPAGSCTP